MLLSVVKDGESAQAAAARLGCPLCMLLRANGLLSAAWIWSGRELAVPNAVSCKTSAFPCLKQLASARICERIAYIVKSGDTFSVIAAKNGIPERIVICALDGKEPAAGQIICLPYAAQADGIHVCLPGEGWKDFKNEADLRLLNNAWGPVYPGMKILMAEE